MIAYIELSEENLIHNYKQFRKYVHPDTKIVSVVKGNAYGHGQDEVTKVLEPLTDYFAVDDINELRQLRTISRKPTLVLGYIAVDDLEEAVLLDAIISVYDEERLLLLNDLGKKLKTKPKIEIKVDAALGRQGILIENLTHYFKKVKSCEFVEPIGLYAHFANIEDTRDPTHALKQIALFEQAKKIALEYGYTNLLTHISSTAGTLVYEKTWQHNSLVRIGLGLYGMWPSEHVRNQYQSQIGLKPVMRWITKVAQVKQVPAGFSIGYGLTYVTEKPMTIAVIPQGYSDGYDRGLSGKGEVLIRGTRCPILGRIAMNMFVVDVTHLADIKPEEEVVLLGNHGKERISAEEIAAKIDTINYEITTRISSLLPRLTG